MHRFIERYGVENADRLLMEFTAAVKTARPTVLDNDRRMRLGRELDVLVARVDDAVDDMAIARSLLEQEYKIFRRYLGAAEALAKDNQDPEAPAVVKRLADRLSGVRDRLEAEHRGLEQVEDWLADLSSSLDQWAIRLRRHPDGFEGPDLLEAASRLSAALDEMTQAARTARRTWGVADDAGALSLVVFSSIPCVQRVLARERLCEDRATSLMTSSDAGPASSLASVRSAIREMMI